MAKAGRKPFGFYQDEAAIVEIIKLKRRRRKGTADETAYSQIARELNFEGFLTRDKKQWYAQTVKNVLEDRPDREPQEKVRGHKKTELSPQDYLVKSEVKECLAVIGDEDLKMLFRFMVGTGVRSCEVRRVKIKDLSLKGDRSQVSILGKGRGKGKQRTVTLPMPLRKRLRKYIKGKQGYLFTGRDGEQRSYRSIYYHIKKIGRKAGFEWLHPHALRHTFGVILYNYKMDILYVRDQLGHASLETTQIYVATAKKGKIGQMNCFNDLM